MPDLYKKVKDVIYADPVETIALGTATTIWTGELVQWDDVNRRGTAHAATGRMFLGVSESSEPIDRSTDARGAIGLQVHTDEIRVAHRGVWKFKTTASETYKHRTPVAMGADAQTVTTVIAGNTVVGSVWRPNGDSVSGAAGTDIEVLLLGFKEAALVGRAPYVWSGSIPAMAAADVGTVFVHPLVTDIPEDAYLLRARVVNRASATAEVRHTILVYDNAGALVGTAFTSLVQTGTVMTANAPFTVAAGPITEGTRGDSLFYVNQQTSTGTRLTTEAVTIEYLPKN